MVLQGQPINEATFTTAAEAALVGAKPLEYNQFGRVSVPNNKVNCCIFLSFLDILPQFINVLNLAGVLHCLQQVRKSKSSCFSQFVSIAEVCL